MKTIVQWAICFSILFFTATRIVAAPYRITKIGVEGREFLRGYLNNAGQIAFSVAPEINTGVPDVPGASYLYDNGVLTNLGGLGGLYTTVSSINEAGQIVGRTQTREPMTFGFLYEKETGMQILTQFGDRGGFAHAINDAGQIVGIAYGPSRAVLLENLDEVTELGTLGYRSSIAYDINNHGQVVGVLTAEDNSEERPFVYENGEMTNLGTLSGSLGGIALANNDLGQIVGMTSVAFAEHDEHHAFIYDADGGMRDIGEPLEYSMAVDINNHGQVVGLRRNVANTSAAFLYDEQNGRQYLIDLIEPQSEWSYLTNAYAINDHGQIIGRGLINGRRIGFLMTPVPEPSTLALLAISALTLPSRRRRHRI